MADKKNKKAPMLSDRHALDQAHRVLEGEKGRGRMSRMLPFLGPAFIASVAYVDPGNFATNIESGAKFGYALLWVIVASNLMAMLIQLLSAKLGIATGKNLAEMCRHQFRPWVSRTMWFLMELVAMATDLAEFLGAAVGFNLLLGVPLLVGGLITAVVTFLILALERYGFRPLEAVITAMVGVIAISYLVVTVMDKPDISQVLVGAFVPKFQGRESIMLATGILGATVMPHAIFLHSALTQRRIMVRHPEKLRRLFRFQIGDVLIAMSIASLVNMAMLIMAAATFHQTGMTSVATIEEAYRTLEPLLGSAASRLFGLALVAAGLSSATVGTSAGQVIMQGFLQRHIPVWIRRLVTMLPSLIVIVIGLDATSTLVLSQVVLSFGLPFAIVPLVLFTRRRDLMGDLVNRKITTAAISVIAALIIALNVYLLYAVFTGG